MWNTVVIAMMGSSLQIFPGVGRLDCGRLESRVFGRTENSRGGHIFDQFIAIHPDNINCRLGRGIDY